MSGFAASLTVDNQRLRKDGWISGVLEIATVDTGKERSVTRTDRTEAGGLLLELVFK